MQSNGLINNSQNQQPTACRGVRGAVTVEANSEEAILSATRELLQIIVKRNGMHPDDIASVYFTTTADLDANYPALAARQMGWRDVALLCGHEMNVPGGLKMCIRVLIHWNTPLSAKEIVHVYLREAQTLRPDRQNLPPVRPRQMNAMEAMVKVMASVL
ncbi:Chorismate mutase II [hydrothermal vent metagenome]|uniref:Chorismate mutase II n=1 Tax=hydrothermal vent metagenome TaxID=652676 RepID=A0A3B0UVK5_9ZZZZ